MQGFLQLWGVGSSPAAVPSVLTAAAPLAAQAIGPSGIGGCGSGALECRLSSGGTRAQLLCGMWNLPGAGIEPLLSALADGFFFFWNNE